MSPPGADVSSGFGSPQRLGDLLEGAGRRLGLPAARETGRLWARWAEVVGGAVAAHAEPTSLRGGVLRVRADSPAWATEIGYLGAAIARRANAVAGADIVVEVRVFTGGRRTGGTFREGPATARGAPPERTHAPSAEDPLEAFARAREAWARRRSGRSH